MAVQLDILTAIEERDKGIQQALDHAESVSTGWKDRAYEVLKEFINNNQGEFQGEEFRAYCAMIEDFVFPPHNRAFGGIILRAAREGLIKKIGIKEVRNPKAHRCFSSVWIKS